MRVVLVIPELGTGGAERVFATLAAHWSSEDRVTVLVVKPPQEDWFVLPAHVGLVSLGVPRLSAGLVSLVRTLRALEPDLVVSAQAHLNAALGLLRFLVPGAAFVGRETGVPGHTGRGRSWWRGLLYRTGYRRLDAVVVPSQAVADELVLRRDVRPQGILRLPNPVDAGALDQDASSDLPPSYGSFFSDAPADAVFVSAVGRLEPVKGFEDLLAAAAALPERFRFVIMGEGSQRAELEGIRDRLGLAGRVHFAGQEPRPGRVTARCQLAVLTSRHEGFPNALLEALTLGVPAVAYRCPGGVAEIVQNEENGFLVLPGDPLALAKALERAAAWPWDRPRIRDRARSLYGAPSVARAFRETLCARMNHD